MPDSIGLIIFATGRYQMFLEGVVASARRHWKTTLPLQVVTFTDAEPSRWLSDLAISTPHLPWPYVTLYRYKHLDQAAEQLGQFTYLYMCDVDMQLIKNIGDEILGDLVATRHAGHVTKDLDALPYIRTQKSTAYVPVGVGKSYYAGGFQGGKTTDYLEACRYMADAITRDEARNRIADWHDESHWNAYLANVRPATVELSPEYCWADGDYLLMPSAKILALSKDHQAMRS